MSLRKHSWVGGWGGRYKERRMEEGRDENNGDNAIHFES